MASVNFPDVPRFEMISRLGEGGMGVVYEAYDREYDVNVALKVLRFSEHGERIQKFKKEFRALQEIRHPNLARFLELMEHDGRWFFTMELVDGMNFLEWIRPNAEIVESIISGSLSELPTEKILMEAMRRTTASQRLSQDNAESLDKERLLDGFVQLARGLLFLHLANKVHRDIKPSNILVDNEGRVVVLDFGLSTTIGEVENGEIFGTPVYMAPELVDHGAAGSAADWYSVGVMLFEALTGKLPVDKILKSKSLRVAPAPSLFDPGVDEMWDFLCTCLMHFDPDKRPSGKEILSLLGSEQAPSPQGPQELDDETLVGRALQLAQLRHAYNGLAIQKASTIFVYGESGVGKTELIGVFGRSLDSRSLLLTGQCYQKESVPYKAVDGIVDSLAAYLRTLVPSAMKDLARDDAPLLMKAFPVLRQVTAFRDAPPIKTKHQHPMELRSRIFHALRTLFRKIAKTRSLVLLIDDLQWADQDSLDLLTALLRQPEEPGMMLVASVRTPSDSIFREKLEKKLEVVSPDVEAIPIGTLDPAAARELARRVSEELGIKNVTPEQIAREADGHPFFIDVLLRYCYTQGRHGGYTLNEALARHIEELSEEDRTLLEVISLAEKPVSRIVAARATGFSLEQIRDSVDSLQSEKLVRGNGIRNTDTIAPYHANVQNVAAKLSPERIQNTYHSLATALEESQSTDLETIARYWGRAGNNTQSIALLASAAEVATSVLAFDKASALYREQIRILAKSSALTSAVWEKLATSLLNSGMASDAADAYEEAIHLADKDKLPLLNRLRAEQLLQCGRVDEGVAGMREVLQGEGFSVPKTTGQVLRSFLWGRVKVKFRSGGIKFISAEEPDVAPSELRRLDALWSACIGLLYIDQLPSLAFHNRHLLLALRVGEPARISRALALEACVLAANDGDRDIMATLLNESESLALQVNSSHSLAHVKMMRSSESYLRGGWLETVDHCSGAVDLLAKCVGVSWDERVVRLLMTWAQVYLGDLAAVVQQASTQFTSAVERGDLYSAIGSASGLPNLAWLVTDQPAMAREKANWGIAQWSQSGYHLQHMSDLLAQVNIDLYERNAESAWSRITTAWPLLKKSGLFKLSLNRVLMYELRGRSALLMATKDSSRVYMQTASACVKQLRREKHSWAHALASLIEVQLDVIGRGAAEEKEFRLVSHEMRSCEMYLYAEIASYISSQVAGENAGSYFSDNKVAAPEKFVRMFVPGLPTK